MENLYLELSENNGETEGIAKGVNNRTTAEIKRKYQYIGRTRTRDECIPQTAHKK